MDSPQADRPRRRWVRPLAGVLLGLVGLFTLALAATVVALHHLDHPGLKQQILPRVEAATGVQLDYRTARVALLSGLRIEGLVVRTPAPLQGAAPELLRIGTVEAQWSLGSLLGGPTRVERVAVREVALTLVADDAGPTSLTALSGSTTPSEPVPAEPSLGTSRQLAAFLASAPPVGKIEVSGVSLKYLRVRNGDVVERWSLDGLAALVEAKQQEGAWKLFANLGQPGTPLPLALSRQGSTEPTGDAALELALSLEAGATEARVRVDLDVVRQSFDARFTVRPLLHGSAIARFDAEKQQTVLELERTQVTDSTHVEVLAVLPDAAEVPVLVTKALADVDLARLLQAIPPELRPVALERGKAHLDARDVTLSALPTLGAQGKLGLDVEVSSLRMTQDALQVALGSGRVSVVATPDTPRGLAAQVAFTLQGLAVDGPTTLHVPKAHGELEGHQLRPEPASALGFAGDATLTAHVPSLDALAGGLRAKAERLKLQFKAPLVGEPPFILSADLPVGELHVVTADGREVLEGPMHVKLDASDVFPHREDPRLSRARGALTLDVGDMHATLNATKGATDVAYALEVQTPDLVVARPFLPDDIAARLGWKDLAVGLTSKGTASALFSAAPRVDHQTELRLQRPTWDDVVASSVALVLRSRGDAWRHQGELDVRAEGLRAGTLEIGTQHQTFTLDVDRRKPSVRLGVTSKAGVMATVDAALSFDRKARALRADVTADLPPLGKLSPLLARFRVPAAMESSRFALKLDLHGTLLGVISDISSEGDLVLAKDLQKSAAYEGHVELDARGIRWRDDVLFINIPAIHWRIDSHGEGAKRNVRSNLTAEKLTVGMHDRRLSFADLASDTTADFALPWDSDEIAVTQNLKARSLEQKPALPYPVQDLALSFTARRKTSGVVHVPDFQLSNPGTSTELKVRGRLDLSDERRRLALRGELAQDLSKLARPDQLESSGKVSVEFRVASPDLVVFRTFSSLLLQNVNVRLPEKGIAVEGLEGNVPLTENIEFVDGQLRLTSDVNMNPYPMLRFADQHPLLERSGFVSATRITTPQLSIAPMAGNLAINQNLVSMTQLEMGVRGGRITGQWLLDWQGRHSTLEARVRATGVQSSRGEPFDGNAAVVISAKDRSVNGRAEILRIGNRHLLDLLDLEDPRQVDPATNRVRYALRLGYPEHVRVNFNHGFGSLSITMGGLARLVSIDEIRGIPMGPIVDQLLKSMPPLEATP
ncbi:hypothetical protein MYSTI_02500 [Myxococcus stipitatus DSM 14675]|uniref:Uncharacterized protein n=1 Tax=Myxococcus stipitatus (strain DSM 14675 / JCM 12634 / Mx s8) TaxID=1278073 RepID=L7U4R1_MYXSD|nr:hypothetical protein MYSTI_02500 [Myxococcus stipitatus DSM 14675]